MSDIKIKKQNFRTYFILYCAITILKFVYAERRKRFRNHFCNFFKQRKFLLNANITLFHNQIVPLRNSCLIIYNIYEETFFFFGNVRLFSSSDVRNEMTVQSSYTEVIGTVWQAFWPWMLKKHRDVKAAIHLIVFVRASETKWFGHAYCVMILFAQVARTCILAISIEPSVLDVGCHICFDYESH